MKPLFILFFCIVGTSTALFCHPATIKKQIVIKFDDVETEASINAFRARFFVDVAFRRPAIKQLDKITNCCLNNYFLWEVEMPFYIEGDNTLYLDFWEFIGNQTGRPRPASVGMNSDPVGFMSHQSLLPSTLEENSNCNLANSGLKIFSQTQNPNFYNSLVTAPCRTAGSQETVVAFFDSGIDPIHAQSSLFQDKLWYPQTQRPCAATDRRSCGYDFVNNQSFPTDDEGHGTFAVGELIQLADYWQLNSTKAMVLKVMQRGVNQGTTWRLIKAVNFALCNGASIFNFSIGSWATRPPIGAARLKHALETALETAGNKGVLVVNGSGNDGISLNRTTYFIPTAFNLKNQITVAGDANNGTLAAFSNRGKPYVHVAAVGQKIYSAGLNGRWGVLSGTSTSSPIVASIAAFEGSNRRTPNFDYMPIRNAIRRNSLNKATLNSIEWSSLARLSGQCVEMQGSPNQTGVVGTNTAAPNPFENLLTVSFEADTEGVAVIELKNSVGKTLISQKYGAMRGDNQVVLKTESLQQGLYLISIEINGHQTWVQKVIKQ